MWMYPIHVYPTMAFHLGSLLYHYCELQRGKGCSAIHPCILGPKTSAWDIECKQ